MLSYPTLAETTPAIRGVITTIVTRAFVANRAQFVKDGWLVLGFGASQLVGEPDGAQATERVYRLMLESKEPITELTDDQLADQLQAVLDGSETNEQGKLEAFPSPDWKAIFAALLPILIKILTA